MPEIHLGLEGMSTPARWSLPGNFTPGSILVVQGRVANNPNRIAINLCNSDESNNMLHFNPRFDQNQTVLNSKRDRQWEEEERIDELVVEPGEEFCATIKCKEDKWKIYIDNYEVAKFTHRFPPEEANRVVILGELTIRKIIFKPEKENRQFHKLGLEGPILPASWPLQRGFTPGTAVTLLARIPENAERFVINFQHHEGIKVKPLHISVRFDQNDVVLNTFRDGSWEEEQRNITLPCHQNSDVTIDVKCEEDAFQISFDGEHLASFAHRMPPDTISHLRIKGDLLLKDVIYKF